MDLRDDQGKIHQLLVKLLDGKHKVFNFETPSVTIGTLKRKIQILTSIPTHEQLLLHQPTTLLHHDHQTFNLIPSSEPHNGGSFPMVVHLLLRLRGGKGGFGSLLRGAATKAGQKKTNNFDACRDMSGRRLRHVNAEKRLEEWRTEAPERKLERIAEDFIKKKGKEVAKKGKGKGGEDTEKYVDKYRKDSAKCMEEVDRSVREALKRKGNEQDDKTHAKRFKIWLGKRKLDDSDSDDVDEEESDEDVKDEGENKKTITQVETITQRERQMASEPVAVVEGATAEDATAASEIEPKQSHKLDKKWSFWFDNQSKPKQQGAAWGSSLRKLYTFETVEEFWSLYDQIFRPSTLPINADFHLFKAGVEPKWEDPECANGGKWTVTSKGKSNLESMWLETLMALIGEQYEEADEICGVVASVRQRQDKISLWTRNASNEAQQMSIGKKWKEIIDVNDKITYSFHDDSKSQRSTKSRYSV